MSQAEPKSNAGRSSGRAMAPLRPLLVAGLLGLAVAATASSIGAVWAEDSQGIDLQSEKVQNSIRDARANGRVPGKMKSKEKGSKQKTVRFELSDVSDVPARPDVTVLHASVPNGKDANGKVQYLTVKTEDERPSDRILHATFDRKALRKAVKASEAAGIPGSGRKGRGAAGLANERDDKATAGAGQLTTTVIVTDQKDGTGDTVVDETAASFDDIEPGS